MMSYRFAAVLPNLRRRQISELSLKTSGTSVDDSSPPDNGHVRGGCLTSPVLERISIIATVSWTTLLG